MSFLAATANEVVNIAFLILLNFLLIENLILKYKFKIISDIRYIIYSLVPSIITSLFIYLCRGSHVLWDVYNITISKVLSGKSILEFLYVFSEKIIFDNLSLIFLFLSGLIILLLLKDNKEKNNKIARYLIYSFLGFIVFFIFLYLLGPTFAYQERADYYLYPRYWVLHPGLLFCFKTFLYTAILYIAGYLSTMYKCKIVKIIFGCIFVLLMLFHIFNYHREFILLHTNPQVKRTMYIIDKISLFYVSRGETIILPKELPFYVIPDIDPYSLAAKEKNYSKIYYRDHSKYLRYLETNYKVDTSKGLGFDKWEDAIKQYYRKGGSFTKKELEKPNFSQMHI